MKRVVSKGAAVGAEQEELLRDAGSNTGAVGRFLNNKWQRRSGGTVIAAGVVTVVAFVPSLVNGYILYLFTLGAIYAVVGLGMTVLLGWTGQISLMIAAFVGLGAYGTDWFFQHGHLPWVVSALVTTLIVSIIGTVLALPALRLRGFYLAIATLALAETIVYGFSYFTAITGGNVGSYVPSIKLFGITTTSSVWYLSAIVLVVAMYVLTQVKRTRLGRILLGVRDSEVAMGPLGARAVSYKLIAFAIASALASIGGALYAQLLTYLSPPQFDLPFLIELLVVVFLGGIDSVIGPLLGAAFVIWLTDVLQSVGTIQPIVFGGTLILVILFLPRGIASLPGRVSELRWPRKLIGRIFPGMLIVGSGRSVSGTGFDVERESNAHNDPSAIAQKG